MVHGSKLNPGTVNLEPDNLGSYDQGSLTYSSYIFFKFKTQNLELKIVSERTFRSDTK